MVELQSFYLHAQGLGVSIKYNATLFFRGHLPELRDGYVRVPV